MESEDDPAPPVPLPSKSRVVVIGGGIMGVATAYWLARLGVDVVLLESRQLASGASGRNAGLMLPASTLLEDPRLTQTVLAEEDIDAGYAEVGHLALASSPEVWEEFQAEAARRREHHAPVYAIDHNACESLLGIRLSERYVGGRWFPQGCLINPVQFVRGLGLAAKKRGAVIVTDTPVTRVDTGLKEPSWSVHTQRGSIDTQYVVYACNAWVVDFLPQLRPFITAVRGQVLSTTPLPPRFRVGLGVDWGTVYWRQTLDGTVILGGYRHVDITKEIGRQEIVNPQVHRALDRFLLETFPDFGPVEISQRWAGIMDLTRDGKPIVGPLPNMPNQWAAVGFGGHGMPAGVGIGKALAESLSSGDIAASLKACTPSRFQKLAVSDAG